MKAVLITGAAKRGGAEITRQIHARGYRVIVHCRHSSLAEAASLASSLNAIRPDSAIVWSCDLREDMPLPPYSADVVGVVASASSYLPSTIDDFDIGLTEAMQTQVSSHLALIRHCKDALVRNNGSIVAITDVHVERPHKDHLAYQIAKGALDTAVRALAVDLAPHVRVNAVAPGALDWPEKDDIPDSRKAKVIETTPLGRIGRFDELASAVCFLMFDATFTTGSTIRVDGGRSIQLE